METCLIMPLAAMVLTMLETLVPVFNEGEFSSACTTPNYSKRKYILMSHKIKFNATRVYKPNVQPAPVPVQLC